MEVKYGQIFYLVPGGLALLQPVKWCSFRLILWPCYSELTACTPLCTAIGAYAAVEAVEGLAMLLSWPASRTELPFPHLTGARRQDQATQ